LINFFVPLGICAAIFENAAAISQNIQGPVARWLGAFCGSANAGAQETGSRKLASARRCRDARVIGNGKSSSSLIWLISKMALAPDQWWPKLF
jgi:hypothetical protein